MADDILGQFLVRIAYQQDEKSRKKFDEGLKQVQTRAAEFGAKIGELPTIVTEATKRISSSLSEMYYSAQKNGATARELDALRYAAEQSGEGADKAEASFNAFSQRIRDFATGAARQYKSLFGVDVDPNHTLDAFIKVREKIEELRNRGGAENLSRANLYARTFGIDEDALIPGRLAEFKKRLDEQLKRNSDIGAEKAIALTRAYNALAAALETVARKADAALFDKFGAVLDRLTKWLDEDSDRIVKFFTDLVTQIGLVFTDLAKLSPAFVFLWDALKEVGGWLQKIIGQPDSSGLAGVRHLLELISGVVMARFVASMVAGFIAAFAPLTALLAGLAALGIIGVGAYTAGEAVRGWFGGDEGTESGGHGSQRRGKFGHGGARGGGGPEGKGGTTANTPAAMAAAEAQLRAEGVPEANVHAAAALLVGQAMAESGLDPTKKHDINPSTGSFGYGIYGASAIRKGPMFAWMAARGFARDSLEGQMKYMVHEAMTTAAYAATRHTLMNATAGSIDRDTRTITPNFEGPAVDNSGTRIGYVRSALEKKGKPTVANPFAHWDPNFDQKLKVFRDAKPLGSDQHSMNEIHDYRSVDNNVNIHVAGASPGDLTARPLGRPKNADLIRNTASYAA